MNVNTTRRARRATLAALASAALVVGLGATSTALVQPGTPAKDVTFGGDNDNADNPFIQPPGVTAKLDMDNTDVLFGRANDDLLIGRLGSDTLLGGTEDDILVGGPEKTSTPNSDTLVGDEGNDMAIWAPGDGNDAFIGNEDRDTMVFAPFVEDRNGAILLTRYAGRSVPRVAIDEQPTFSCTVVGVPESENLGFQFIVRFNVEGSPVVSVRQKDVERVYCPSPERGRAMVADLGDDRPYFRSVRLDRVRGTVGQVLEPVG